MIALLQRVTQARVEIHGQLVGCIEQGILALIGIQPQDNIAKMTRLSERLLNYRMFSDQTGRMNLSLRDIQGGLLLVPQFTLAADTNAGNRPSFSTAADPEEAKALFGCMYQHIEQIYPLVAKGEFGADMQVSLTNDGPVTFWLEV